MAFRLTAGLTALRSLRGSAISNGLQGRIQHAASPSTVSTSAQFWQQIRLFSEKRMPIGKRRSFVSKKPTMEEHDAKAAELVAQRFDPGRPEGILPPPVKKPKWYVVTALWTVGSVIMGVTSLQVDDVPERAMVLAAHPDRARAKIMADKMDKLETALKNAVECADFSEEVRAVISNDPIYLDRLYSLVASPASTTEVRNLAARLLEAVASGSDETKKRLVSGGQHMRLIELCDRSDASLFVRRKLGNALCSLASVEGNCMELGRAGAVPALQKLYDNRFLARRSQVVAMQHISAVCEKVPESARWAEHWPGEWEMIERYAADDRAERQKKFYDLRTSILESGLLLYFHTAGGGLVWGTFESLRARKSLPEVLRYGIRTSLVTCMVPIYFVGACVSLYNYAHSQATDSFDIFALNTGTAMTLLPWYYILPRVEAFSPYWIGGHVVGFVSFFVYLYFTRSDTLRNDNLLKQKDVEYMQWKARKQLQQRNEAAAEA
eukprot:comp46115_c0_seq1/m.47568 comp46115_c0_seq1/g.47568  ORF comp46115_c0_seq1/g.47568 comp46115_c0_seq1/m.47568 type:complete len:494 (-) comp46115_c0_seq1:159-1640(-)